ncbi:hypothetical protein Dimus_029658 [Dionaea muscipula]
MPSTTASRPAATRETRARSSETRSAMMMMGVGRWCGDVRPVDDGDVGSVMVMSRLVGCVVVDGRRPKTSRDRPWTPSLLHRPWTQSFGSYGSGDGGLDGGDGGGEAIGSSDYLVALVAIRRSRWSSMVAAGGLQW